MLLRHSHVVMSGLYKNYHCPLCVLKQILMNEIFKKRVNFNINLYLLNISLKLISFRCR